MAITVRELVTKWGFKVDEKPLTEMEKKISSLRRSILYISGAAVASGGALFALANNVAKLGDEAIKASQSAGINVETFQELAFAAKLSDIEHEAFTISMQKFSRSINDARNGMKTYIDPLKRVGITTSELNDTTLTADDFLLSVADAFKNMPDGINKTATAMELFGRSGGKLIPFLNEGKEGINKLREEARSLGIVMDEETTRRAEEFNDSFTRMGAAFEGVKIIIGTQLIPVITKITLQIRDWVIQNRELLKQRISEFIEILISFLKVFLSTVNILMKSLSFFIKIVGGAANSVRILTVAMFAFISYQFIVGITALITVIGKLRMAFRLAGIEAAIAWVKVAAPIIGIIALITAIILIIEDIWGFFHGKNSITGLIVESFSEAFQHILNFFTKVKGLFTNFFKNARIGTSGFNIGKENVANTAQSLSTQFKGAENALTNPTPTMRGLSSPTTKQSMLNVQSPITVNVPPGTDPNQVGSFVQNGVKDGLSSVLRETMRNNKPQVVF